MAKKSTIESNKKKIEMVACFRKKRSELKRRVMDKGLTLKDRFDATLMLAELPRNSASVRVRSLCQLTGRSRGVYRFFGLSRIPLRELAMTAKLPGVRRSSW